MLRAPAAAAGMAAAITLAAIGPAAAQDSGAMTTTTYQDWEVRCQGESDCTAVHKANDAFIAVKRQPDSGQLVMSFIVSPKTTQGAPVGLRLDSGWNAQLSVAGCQEKFCEAPIDPAKTDRLVEQFKKETGGIAAYPVSGQVAIAKFSLMGFADAVSALEK